MKRSQPPRRKKPLQRGKPPARSRRPIAPRRADPAKRRWAKHRDPAYELWIESLPCLICKQHPVDPAHIKHRSTGGDDRKNLVPLCRVHHNQQEGKTIEFEVRYRLDLKAIALLLDAQYASTNSEALDP